MIDAGTVVRLVYMEIAIVGGLLAERPHLRPPLVRWPMYSLHLRVLQMPISVRSKLQLNARLSTNDRASASEFLSSQSIFVSTWRISLFEVPLHIQPPYCP